MSLSAMTDRIAAFAEMASCRLSCSFDAGTGALLSDEAGTGTFEGVDDLDSCVEGVPDDTVVQS